MIDPLKYPAHYEKEMRKQFDKWGPFIKQAINAFCSMFGHHKDYFKEKWNDDFLTFRKETKDSTRNGVFIIQHAGSDASVSTSLTSRTEPKTEVLFKLIIEVFPKEK